MKSSKLFGLHSVQAALDYSPKKIQQAWVDSGRQDKRLSQAVDDLLALGIVPEKVDRKRLDKLADIYVEGLVHISNLGQDYYHFDPTSHQLKGERSGTNFRLGDRVKIRVARVDLDEKKMDFELIQKDGAATATKEPVSDKPKKRRRKKK